MASEGSTLLLTEIEEQLAALEAACADAERILAADTPEGLERSIWDQRRLTHALQNAMDLAVQERTPEFDEAVRVRLRVIGLIRDRHIELLKGKREKVGHRLSTLTNWKRASRKWLTGYTTARGTGVDLLR